jgi:putative transposase
MCKVLNVSRSSYYNWLRRNPSRRSIENRELSDLIKKIYELSKRTYGSPRVTIELHKRGFHVSRQRVARLMKSQNLKSIIRKKWVITTDSRHNYPVVENKLNRDFNTTRPGQVWVSDISVPQQSGVRDEGRPLATSLQERVANHRKRRKSKVYVVSVTEKVP